jgi:transposase-like protein
MQELTCGISVAEARAWVKEWDWEAAEGDYREAGRQALQEILETRMANWVDAYLEELERRAPALPDRRNGYFERHLLTELGDISLAVPRTRRTSAAKMLKKFKRRPAQVDRAILECFVLGCSTRKVGEALAPLLGEEVSAATVSAVAKQLDAHVAAFHRRRLQDQYKFLIFDGVVMKQKTGAGAVKRTALVARGIRADGKKENIDFYLAHGESQEEWEAFLNDLYQRGLVGENAELIVSDGGKGLLAALGLVYARRPVQRCWAHKTRNILDKVKKKDQAAVKHDLHQISHAPHLRSARTAARRFADKWGRAYPKAVDCLRQDLDSLLEFLRFDPKWRKEIRTTNAIERQFREVRRRTRPMGVFSDRTSVERILYAVLNYANRKQGVAPLLLLTQKT